MDRLLELLLRRFVRRGTLRFTTARGSVFTVGDGSGPPVAIRFMTKAAQRGVLLDPELKLGEAYMDGTLAWSSKAPSPTCSRSCSARPTTACRRLGAAAMVAALFLPAAAAAQSCRRARGATSRITTISTAGSIRCSSTPTGNTPAPISSTPDQSLDDAQLAKKRHLAAKLLLEDRPARARHRLRLGRAWRSISPNSAGAHVTGITLSQEQWQRAGERAAEKGLTGSVDFRMQDYRDLQEQFDRIVSVGMFEHVGVGLLRRLLPQMRRAA